MEAIRLALIHFYFLNEFQPHKVIRSPGNELDNAYIDDLSLNPLEECYNAFRLLTKSDDREIVLIEKIGFR